MDALENLTSWTDVDRRALRAVLGEAGSALTAEEAVARHQAMLKAAAARPLHSNSPDLPQTGAGTRALRKSEAPEPRRNSQVSNRTRGRSESRGSEFAKARASALDVSPPFISSHIPEEVHRMADTGNEIVRQIRSRRAPVRYDAPIAPPHSVLRTPAMAIVVEREHPGSSGLALVLLFCVGVLAVGMSTGLVRVEALLSMLLR